MPLVKKSAVNSGRINTLATSLDSQSTSIRARIDGVNDQIAKLKPQLAPGSRSRESARLQITKLIQQRKQFENQLAMVDRQAMNITSVQTAVSMAETTKETYKAMKDLHKSMSKMAIDPDKVAALQEDMTELMYDINEITDVMSQDFMVPDGMTDAGLELELNMLEDEIRAEPMAAAGQKPVYLEQSAEPEAEFVV